MSFVFKDLMRIHYNGINRKFGYFCDTQFCKMMTVIMMNIIPGHRLQEFHTISGKLTAYTYTNIYNMKKV